MGKLRVVKLGTVPCHDKIDGRFKVEVGRQVRVIVVGKSLSIVQGSKSYMAYVDKIDPLGQVFLSL